MCIVHWYCAGWYITMTLCTWSVLVHYTIVVNPCRPIRGPAVDPYREVTTELKAGDRVEVEQGGRIM